VSDGGAARLSDGEVAFCAPPTRGSGVTHLRTDEALFFEAIERGVERAKGWFAARACSDLSANGNAVSVFSQPQDCEKDDLLEFAES